MLALVGKIRIKFVFNVFLYYLDFQKRKREKQDDHLVWGREQPSFRNTYYKLFSRKNISKYVSN